MTGKLPTLLSEVECAKFQLDGYTLQKSYLFNSPSGRFNYLFFNEDNLQWVIAFDTWKQTETLLLPTENSARNFPPCHSAPCFVDDYTMIHFKRNGGSPDFYNYSVKFNLENRSFEAQSLGIANIWQPFDFTFSIAIECDWLLFASRTQGENDCLFWFNIKTLELKQFQSIRLSFGRASIENTFFKNNKLYLIYVAEKKIKCYDLSLHLPWLSTFDVVGVPTSEVKIRGAFKEKHWFCPYNTLKQRDKDILYNYERNRLRILDFNTGRFRGFKLPSAILLNPYNTCPHLINQFVFDDDILTVYSMKGACCANPVEQVEMKTIRFALRRPESLFKLAWFQRPRDFAPPNFIIQRL